MSSGRERHGVFRSKPKAEANWPRSRPYHEEPPWVTVARHPAAIDRSGSKTSFSGSISLKNPSPEHWGHAPCGELKEKSRGETSEKENPHSGQANRDDSWISSPPTTEIRTNPSPTFKAVSREEAKRLATPSRTDNRSMTTSIVWFLFLSRSGLSEISNTSPSIRTLTKPSRSICSNSFRCSPFRALTIGARTRNRLSTGRFMSRSTI